MITRDEAKQLRPGDILLDQWGKRWKVSGQVKTWKRDANRIRVPLKHGLYSYDALTGADFDVNGECRAVTLRSDHTE